MSKKDPGDGLSERGNRPGIMPFEANAAIPEGGTVAAFWVWIDSELNACLQRSSMTPHVSPHECQLGPLPTWAGFAVIAPSSAILISRGLNVQPHSNFGSCVSHCLWFHSTSTE